MFKSINGVLFSGLHSFVNMSSFISISFFNCGISESSFEEIFSFANISVLFIGIDDTEVDKIGFFAYSTNPDFIILSNSCSILANF